jgi:capsular exopolysaccharide synthesis family protein
MMSQDNRLLPLSQADALDRPLRELAQPVPVASSNSAAEPAHLREYLAVVLKRKWLILSLMVVVTSLVAIQMYRMPSIYSAKTQLEISQKKNSVLTTGRGGDLVIRGGNDANYWNTQLKLLETQQLARQVILRLGLHNNPSVLATHRGTGVIAALRRVLSGGQPAPTPQPESAVPVVSDANEELQVVAEQVSPELAKRLEPYEDMLRANLTVEPVERTNLVYLHFQHTDPKLATDIVNTYATVFAENDRARETDGSKRADKVLAEQVIKLQEQIRADETARFSYMKGRNLPLGEKPGQDFTAFRLTNYSQQLQAAEAERKDAEAAYTAARNTRDTAGIWAIPQVQSDKNVQELKKKIVDLEEQRAALLVNYTEEWPAVRKIDEQIKRLKVELERTPNDIIAGLKARYDAALQKEQQMRTAYFRERGAANAQSEAERGLGELTQNIETNKQLYQTYLQRLNELRVTSSDRSDNVTIVEAAREPRAPVGPQRVRNIAIALLLSLGVGIGLAFLLDYLDDTLKSVEDVDRHLHLPTLALIPAPREVRRLRGRGPVPEHGSATALALIEDVRSPVTESYRHLRTALLLSSAGQPPKTILVTSSQPSEGKTTTAVNIATILAQTGADVLILDCDLRRPRVHTHFGVSNARGVTNYLSGEANVSEIIQEVEQAPNLKVIPSGPVPPNAAELLGSDEMRKLLYVLSENFTHIVIDSPPAISFTDASILSTMVDGVMLVVHGGRSSRAVVRRAKQQLQDVGAHIFGIVLNNVKLEASNYYYYSGYYSGYYNNEEELPEGAEVAGDGRAPR